MTINLYNTLTGNLEPLAPGDGTTFRMYACGPTVYDYGHIGNFRTFVHVDVLRRVLHQRGIATRHVMNITDVDDKIIRNASAAGVTISEYTPRIEQAFFEDLKWLNVEQPEIISRATENIPEMVDLVQKLAAEDAAYQGEDGSWYFRIAAFADYGKLSKKDLDGIEVGARVDVDEYNKNAGSDFALWKAAKPGEHAWKTAIGEGRPGWHIECSAMAMKYLGPSFDLHAGGEDLMFPHHENEIAQSESVTHQTFARHWMHIRFLLVDGRKMSKSEGNFYTLRDLLLKGHRASAIRMLLLSVPYRHQLNFTMDGLAEATNSIERLRVFHDRIAQGSFPEGENPALDAVIAKSAADYDASLSDDLNTAEARAAIFEMVRAANVAVDQGRMFAGNKERILALLIRFDAVFAVLEDNDEAITRAALAWAEAEGRMTQASEELIAKLALSNEQIDALIEERNQARKSRNFARADEIRKELAEKNILIEDSKDGVRWKRK
jgi:cysteinyl-tRNA synthetase